MGYLQKQTAERYVLLALVGLLDSALPSPADAARAVALGKGMLHLDQTKTKPSKYLGWLTRCVSMCECVCVCVCVCVNE